MTLSYADQFNARYNYSESDYVDVPTRFQEFVDENRLIEIKMACREFKRRNPQWKKFSDIPLCIAQKAKGSQLGIDKTMQRFLIIDSCVNKVDGFKSTKVMPIQVNPHPTEEGSYTAWDGQHTVIMLYIICTFVFGENWDEVDIPIVIYPTTEKAEIREGFVGLNGEDKNPLDPIDIWMQMLYGVRVDSSQNPKWLDANEKQKRLEKFKLFATHEKFDNAHEVGAISRLAEIDKATADDLHLFGIYWAAIRQQRAVQPKESYMMLTWIMLCRTEGVKLDEDYMLDLADMATSFWRADFSPSGPFWAKAELAYENWHEEKYKDFKDADKPEPSMQKLPTHGIPFLNAQIQKTLKRKVPAYFANNGFKPAEEDLW
jgi:hypothetical protein